MKAVPAGLTAGFAGSAGLTNALVGGLGTWSARASNTSGVSPGVAW